MYKTILVFLVAVFLPYFLSSCGDVNNPSIPPIIPDPIDSLKVPTNLKVDSTSIYLFIDKTDTNNHDTVPLGRLRARWDTVPGATYYAITVFKGTINNLDTIISTDPANLLKNQLIIDSLEPNLTYWLTVQSLKIIINGADTTIANSNKSPKVMVSDFYQPLPPEHIDTRILGNSVRISWKANPDTGVTGYTVYKMDPFSNILDSLLIDKTTLSTLFSIAQDSVYKFNIRTSHTIGPGIICSTYSYDQSNAGDNNFKLPYIHLSTYTVPAPLPLDSLAGEMTGVTGGIFVMGNIWDDTTKHRAENDRPAHEVIISSFYLGKSEVTNAQYIKFLNAEDTICIHEKITTTDTLIIYTLKDTTDTIINISAAFWHISRVYDSTPQKYEFVVDSGFSNYPVAGILWKGGAAFCNWLTSKDPNLTQCYDTNWIFNTSANGYRLPTEAEFEYVQSGASSFPGTKQRFPWGYKDNPQLYGSTTTGLGPVGRYDHYGFADLTGNVAEWCNDWSDSLYYQVCLDSQIVYDPIGPVNGQMHLLRGGSYKQKKRENSSHYRDIYPQGNRSGYGFRLARNK